MTNLTAQLAEQRRAQQQAEREAQRKSYERYAELLLQHATDPTADTSELRAEIVSLGLSDSRVNQDLEKISELRYDLEQAPYLEQHELRRRHAEKELREYEAAIKDAMQRAKMQVLHANNEVVHARQAIARIEQLQRHERLQSLAIIPKQIPPTPPEPFDYGDDEADFVGDVGMPGHESAGSESASRESTRKQPAGK